MFSQDPETVEREYSALVSADAPAPKIKKKKVVEDGDEEGEDDFTTVGKGGKSMQFTAESIFKNLQLVQEARGKKVRMLDSSFCILHIHNFAEYGSCGANPHLGETS